MGFKELIDSKDMVDLYRVSRFMYSIGKPIISDASYTKVEAYVKQKFSDNVLLRQNYESDAVPSDLFSKYDIRLNRTLLAEMNAKRVKDHPRYLELKERINEFMTQSIEAYSTYKAIFDWYYPRRRHSFILSLKVDGVSTRSIVCSDDETQEEPICNLAICGSRAREGRGHDYTNNIATIFPKDIKLKNSNFSELRKALLVYGEAYMLDKSLPYLREKYHMQDEWVNSRSTALSALTTGIQPEDYAYLKLKVFKVTGLANKQSESLTIAKDLGFDVVPWKLVLNGEIPETFEEFSIWLKDILLEFAGIAKDFDIESDGVVMEIDNQADFLLEKSDDHYTSGNIAMKLDFWGSKYYKARILGFEETPKKVGSGLIALIEPTTVYNRATVGRVSCFNWDIVIDQKLLPYEDAVALGSPERGELCFEYKSASSINLLRKDANGNYKEIIGED